MTPTIVALVSYWNEEERLPGLIRSLDGHVDTILFLDGAYEGFPGATSASTDASRGVIQACVRTLKHEMRAVMMGSPGGKLFPNEPVKRSLLLLAVENDAWMLVIDCDERLQVMGGVNLRDVVGGAAMPADRAFRVWVEDPECGTVRARLMRKTPGLRYGPRHWEIVDDVGNVGVDDARVLESVTIVHKPRRHEDMAYREARRVYDKDVRPTVEQTHSSRFGEVKT